MSMGLIDVAKQTDWALLRMQKAELVNVLWANNITGSQTLALQGILHWLDSLQDAAVVDGVPEREVFGECALDDDD